MKNSLTFIQTFTLLYVGGILGKLVIEVIKAPYQLSEPLTLGWAVAVFGMSNFTFPYLLGGAFFLWLYYRSR